MDAGGRLGEGTCQTRWPRILLWSVPLGVLAAAGCRFVGQETRTAPARWRLDSAFTPAADDTVIPIVEMESECSPGLSALGRLHADVKYTAAAVTIGIQVDVLGGDQTCEGVDTRTRSNSASRSGAESWSSRTRSRRESVEAVHIGCRAQGGTDGWQGSTI